MEDNHIYQFSLLNALMDGVCDTGITVEKLLKKGNQGLGTFIHMDGELLLLDGKVYQLRAHGDVQEAGLEAEIPYVVSTYFVPQKTVTATLENKDSIDEIIDQANKQARNLFITYRIEGTFQKVKCRTVKGQEYPGQPLSELGKSQFVDTYNNIEGTVVGFRSPELWQGLSVAGEHLHFIDKDRKVGGHVIELNGERVEMKMATIADVHIELPRTKDFNDASLLLDNEGIKEVEG